MAQQQHTIEEVVSLQDGSLYIVFKDEDGAPSDVLLDPHEVNKLFVHFNKEA